MAVKVKENLGCVPLVLSVFPRQTIGIGVVFGQEFWLLTGRIKVYFSTFDDTSAKPLCFQIWHCCRASIGSQLWDYWGELCKMCFKSPKCDGIPPRRCDGSFEDGDEVIWKEVNDKFQLVFAPRCSTFLEQICHLEGGMVLVKWRYLVTVPP